MTDKYVYVRIRVADDDPNFCDSDCEWLLDNRCELFDEYPDTISAQCPTCGQVDPNADERLIRLNACKVCELEEE